MAEHESICLKTPTVSLISMYVHTPGQQSIKIFARAAAGSITKGLEFVVNTTLIRSTLTSENQFIQMKLSRLCHFQFVL